MAKGKAADASKGASAVSFTGGTGLLVKSFEQVLQELIPREEFADGQHSDGGMRETPVRMAKAWKEWTRGYYQDPNDLIKSFDKPYDVDQMVHVANLPVYSLCEHHGAPFHGVAHVAYIPGEKILGLSKFARILNVFACRFQVQERLTVQVADFLMGSALEPEGVAVQIVCSHSCMSSRGVRAHGSSTVTTALRGLFGSDTSAKDEFLRQCHASASYRSTNHG